MHVFCTVRSSAASQDEEERAVSAPARERAAPRGTNTPTLSNSELDSLVSKLMAGDQRGIVIYFVPTYSDSQR